MKILLFHPVPLPPKDYGGVERVVLWLATALRDRGHEVWIAAREGSVLPEGVHCLEIPENDQSALSLVKRLPPGIEVVHFHAPPEQGAMESLPCASILTVHGNGKAGEVFPKNTVFLSKDHARRHGRQAYVYNGIDPSEFKFGSDVRRKKKPLFLSKTTLKTKNLPYAMRIARRSGLGLTIAGGRRPILARMKSLVFGFDWVGPVAGSVKSKLLEEASCLIFPIQWDEPFGLVVVEAMISGTPVFAPPRGAMSELITEKTGKLIGLDDEEEWIRAIRSANRYDPTECRNLVLNHFTHWHMAENYLSMYRKAIQGVPL